MFGHVWLMSPHARPLSHLTLLGFSTVFVPLSEWCGERGIGCTILTAPDQADQVRSLGLPFAVVERLDSAAAQHPAAFAPDGLALSCGARWIFRKAEIEGLFHGRLINAHGTRLPLDRGGGGFSWRIMRGDRIGALLLHQIDEGVDTGAIVAFEDYVIPASCRTPADIQADYERRLAPFIVAAIESGAAMRSGGLSQQMALAAYYPRLHTPTHSWIDWSWSAAEIEQFATAFDDPHPGARTQWRGETVVIRQVQAHFGEPPHHPFQAGLVFRNNGRWLMVALGGGGSLIVEKASREDGENLITKIREGDRLQTPAALLQDAREQRVAFGPGGLKLGK